MHGLSCYNLWCGLGVVGDYIARADEQDVTEVDFGALILGGRDEVLKQDRACLEGVVGSLGRFIFQPPGVVVEEHTAAYDALFCHGLDAVYGRAAAVSISAAAGAVDVGHGHAIVEEAFVLVGIVAETVPLRGDLGVEGPSIIVDYASARGMLDKFLVEDFSLEEGGGLLGVEGPVEGDTGGQLLVLDFENKIKGWTYGLS